MTAVLVWLVFCWFAMRRLRRYLHMLQQDDYNARRFLAWMWQQLAFDRRVSLALVGAGLVGCLIPVPETWAWSTTPTWLVIPVLVGLTLAEPDPRKEGKKKLVMTARARRIFWIAMILTAALAGFIVLLCWACAFGMVLTVGIVGPTRFPILLSTLFWILPVQAIPFLMLIANWLLSPVESLIQKRYWTEAHAKLLELNPTVTGITGSFGKTSTKLILAHILDLNTPTLATPGSINTPMGVSRIIRENLLPAHKNFVVEMGAYGVGSIAKLCRLAPPACGIITAVGLAHRERFKTLETVAKAKFELAEAVIAAKGKIVIHEDALNTDYARAFVQAHRQSFVVCGGKDADVPFTAQQTKDGLAITMRWQGEDVLLTVPLYGAHHGGNIALAFTMAMVLGVSPAKAAIALKSTPQIKHRLEVKRQAGSATYIDDAFNSNPAGFAAALDILALLGAPGGQRILVTPGMVELGDTHDETHYQLGLKAAATATKAIVVKAARIPTFIKALTEKKADILEVNAFSEADSWLRQNARSGDIVLLENDLPDLYERTLKL